MVSFRPALKNDHRAIATLHAKSWKQNYRGAFSDHFLDNEVLSDRLGVWKNRLTKPKESQFVYLAETEGALVAFVCGYLDQDPEYGTLIDNLHVDSEFIGQRIGEKLMVLAAEFLKDKNRPSMYLWVLTSNTKAIGFYRRIGGIPIDTINGFDIGDREIMKTRFYWSSLKLILGQEHNKRTNEH